MRIIRKIAGDICDGVLQSSQKKERLLKRHIEMDLEMTSGLQKRELCEGTIMESVKWTLGEGYWKED